MINNNPFKQAPNTWLVEFSINFANVDNFINAFESIASSVSYYELEGSDSVSSKATDLWRIQLYFDYKPDLGFIEEKLKLAAASYDISKPDIKLSMVDDKDWVSYVQQNAKPSRVGRYFVYSSHFQGKIPDAYIPLLVDAGRAFGTGEHETTSGCLLALSLLAKKYDFSNMLDMGCGTGILACAMAKLWKHKVLAVDIDHQAVAISEANARINNVSHLVISAHSNGYKSKVVQELAPYDLIVANILARPLIKFAKDLSTNLNSGGIAILSGLLGKQKNAVLNAHRCQGLSLLYSISRNHWDILVLVKR